MISLDPVSSTRPPIIFKGKTGPVKPAEQSKFPDTSSPGNKSDAPGSGTSNSNSTNKNNSTPNSTNSLPPAPRPRELRPSISPTPPGKGEGPSGSGLIETIDKNGVSGSSESDTDRPGQLSPEERRMVQKLKRIDARVRAHEQAHLAAAGQYAQGGIQFEYTRGPDGKRYAVGGQVNLDTSNEETPEETIRKMRKVRQAALAPAQPSPQDQQVATEASRKLSEARQKKLRNQNSGSEFEVGSSESSQENKGPNQSSSPEENDGNAIGDITESGNQNSSDSNQGIGQSGGTERFEDFGRSFSLDRENSSDRARNQRAAAVNTVAGNQSNSNQADQSNFITSDQVQQFQNERNGQFVNTLI